MKDEMIVNVTASLFEENDRQAAKNRRAFQEMGTVVLNLISSPGSGKTSLLERTIARLKDRVGIGVIEGDPETARDAERIRRQGVPVIQLTTGGGCHLDAPMVDKGLQALTRGQSRVPGLLRSGRNEEGCAAFRAGRFRQAGQIPRHLPQR